MKDFTNLYALSKTLRFELIPQGKTLENITSKGLIEQDKRKATLYKDVKKIIDEYHKYFIHEVLTNARLSKLDLYYKFYSKITKTDEDVGEFEELKKDLRKQISALFTKHKLYEDLFSSNLIKEVLLNYVNNDSDKEALKEFSNFTTYFIGFHENRKNMYVADEKSTSIAYRLIDLNLSKFIDNIISFQKIKSLELSVNFNELYENLKIEFNDRRIEEIFTIENFNNVLSQKGIENYNNILRGFSTEENKKIKGLNEYINLYNQKTKDKLPKLKPLFKQILSDRNTISFVPEQFENDEALLESCEIMFQEFSNDLFNGDESLQELFANIHNYELDKIYIKNDLALTDISNKLFGHWNTLQKAIEYNYVQNYKGKLAIGSQKFEDEKEKALKKNKSYSISFLNNCMTILYAKENMEKIEAYFSSIGKKEISENYVETIFSNYKSVSEILNSYDPNKKLIKDDVAIEKIKLFLDSIKVLQKLIKPILGNGDEAIKDNRFYASLQRHWEILDQITPYYNKVRNYLTQKPYSVKKVKLNFENSQLLNGWDLNKEADYTSILLEKDERFYLAIMDKKYNKLFHSLPEVIKDEFYHKVNYKLLPGANKMLPKVFFSVKNIDYYRPSNKILDIRNHASHTKNGKPKEGYEKKEFSMNDCREMINFYKNSIKKHEDWKNFGFQFQNTDAYNSIDEFYRDVENQGYNITFSKIESTYLDTLVNEGKIYLFQIYNKDFSTYSKGTPNLHTIYWKMLFDPINLKDVVYKLNGQAEIFYREKSISDDSKIIHPANQHIENKNKLNPNKESVFNYDIIKNRRYTLDKFQFHVPITLNFKSNGNNLINEKVNHYLNKLNEFHVIGIDRGERHLLYISIIDSKGIIKDQYSLNEIITQYKNVEYTTNYKALLNTREQERTKARESWKTIENIKELKEGYMSAVIQKICKLMVEKNAIVVLEDLNSGFIRGRQKVEKQVYQKFEKMLINKLNYYVDKNKNIGDIGGKLKAYQLTNKFVSFDKIGKQSGFLFYVPAWNTSKIDPTTGFVNMFNCTYETNDKAKQFFSNFEKIVFNESEDYFEFHVNNYAQFNPKAADTKQDWIICSNSTRVLTQRDVENNNNWTSKQEILTKLWKALLKKYDIDYMSFKLKEDICNKIDKKFFKSALDLFKLTVQMRNSETNTNVDYLISPIKGKDGTFFDSRNKKDSLPIDADANGAYNIARKGLMYINQIKKSKNLKSLKLSITNKEWLHFVQGQM